MKFLLSSIALLAVSVNGQVDPAMMQKVGSAVCDRMPELFDAVESCTKDMFELADNKDCNSIADEMGMGMEMATKLMPAPEGINLPSMGGGGATQTPQEELAAARAQADTMCNALSQGRRLLSQENDLFVKSMTEVLEKVMIASNMQQASKAITASRRRLDAVSEMKDMMKKLTPKLMDTACKRGGCAETVFSVTTGTMKCMVRSLMPIVRDLVEILKPLVPPAQQAEMAKQIGTDDQINAELQKVIDEMKKGLLLICTKNYGGDYCVIKGLHVAKQFEKEFLYEPTISEKCSAVASMGCCFSLYADMAGDEIVSKKKEILSDCKLTAMASACPAPGTETEVVSISITLSGTKFADYEGMDENKKEAIQWAVAQDVGKALGVDPSRVGFKKTVSAAGDQITITVVVSPPGGKSAAAIKDKASDAGFTIPLTKSAMELPGVKAEAVTAATTKEVGASISLEEGNSSSVLVPSVLVSAVAMFFAMTY